MYEWDKIIAVAYDHQTKIKGTARLQIVYSLAADLQITDLIGELPNKNECTYGIK
jgi:hypothetical protein